MDREYTRRIIVMLALVGMAISVLRLTPRRPLPSIDLSDGDTAAQPATPREELAEEMELFRVSVYNGSNYSVEAFRSIEHLCHDHQDDETMVQACSEFDEALSHHIDRHTIDDAVHRLRAD